MARVPEPFTEWDRWGRPIITSEGQLMGGDILLDPYGDALRVSVGSQVVLTSTDRGEIPATFREINHRAHVLLARADMKKYREATTLPYDVGMMLQIEAFEPPAPPSPTGTSPRSPN